MKKALVSYQGFVSQIVDPGEDFDIYEGPDATIAWVDAPDNIQREWTLEYSPSAEHMIWVERDGAFSDSTVARRVAYGELGEQLGMIFDDIKEHGTLNTDSLWFQHCQNVKDLIEQPEVPEPISLEEMMAREHTEEPSVDRPVKPSSQETPAWKRYPNWKGYKG